MGSGSVKAAIRGNVRSGVFIENLREDYLLWLFFITLFLEFCFLIFKTFQKSRIFYEQIIVDKQLENYIEKT